MTDTIDFHGCYEAGWRGLITDASFAHPAKAVRGLIRRIFAHMEAQGWLPPGSRVLDVFGGIGTTGIEGASRGHEVVCVELEERFYKLAIENFAIHLRAWETCGDPLPTMIHGDSRRAVELVRGHFGACVGSQPPNIRGHRPVRSRWKDEPDREDNYGQSPGQLGAMPTGDVDAVVGSPPFGAALSGGGISAAMRGEGNYDVKTKMPGSCYQPAEQGIASGNLAAMPEGNIDAAISSPPYAKTVINGDRNFQSAKCPDAAPARDARADGYGGGKDNLGNLPEGDVDAVVGSPPYEDSADAQRTCMENGTRARQATSERGTYQPKYGDKSGQLGAESGETFWAASRTILEQVHQLLKPGGYCAWIVKAYVKKGQIVDFPGNWQRLCEAGSDSGDGDTVPGVAHED